MTENEKRWAARVAAWRASGLSSVEFSEGREFTAGGLRHWAYRLGKRSRKKSKARKKGRKPAVVRLARVARRPSPRPSAIAAADAGPASGSPLVLKVGTVQVAVERGFDRETLAGVLEILAPGGSL